MFIYSFPSSPINKLKGLDDPHTFLKQQKQLKKPLKLGIKHQTNHSKNRQTRKSECTYSVYICIGAKNTLQPFVPNWSSRHQAIASFAKRNAPNMFKKLSFTYWIREIESSLIHCLAKT